MLSEEFGGGGSRKKDIREYKKENETPHSRGTERERGLNEAEGEN